jgi:hypothetical protein
MHKLVIEIVLNVEGCNEKKKKRENRYKVTGYGRGKGNEENL